MKKENVSAYVWTQLFFSGLDVPHFGVLRAPGLKNMLFETKLA